MATRAEPLLPAVARTLAPWQHVMLHGLTACACVERSFGRDYARAECPDCRGAGVALAAPSAPAPTEGVVAAAVAAERERCLAIVREERGACVEGDDIDAVVMIYAERRIAEGR